MSSPLDYFDRIYIVNLASRDDRRREMQEQLAHVGLSLTTPPVELYTAVRPPDAGPFPSLGARGCFMSHLGVLQAAQAAGAQRVLICEDDLNFDDHFMQRIGAVVDGLRGRAWDIFYGGYDVKTALPAAAADGLVTVAADLPVGTTHFIAFQGQAIGAAARYLDAMRQRAPGDPQGGPMHVDGAYNWFRREHPQRVTVLADPQLGYQRPSRTDIHSLRWFDRLPLTRELAALARRWRGR